MNELILKILEESIAVKAHCIKTNLERILIAADRLAIGIASGHKILLFGNGGSAADSQHIAAEFVNRFQIERRPLPAMALTTDTSVMTSIGNDYSFDLIFAKQIQALGQKDDVAIGISTSGNSKNVVEAIHAAKSLGIYTIGFSGNKGGRLAECADLTLTVESDNTARIQETHITIGHILCELTDRILFGRKDTP